MALETRRLSMFPAVVERLKQAKADKDGLAPEGVPPRILDLVPVLGVPMNRFLLGAVRGDMTERFSSFQDFLDKSCYSPEGLTQFLTSAEIEIVASMEAFREDMERATPSATDLVSVIMPTINRFDDQMENAIYSVLLQSHRKLELLLLDNSGKFSQEGFEQISDPRLKVIDSSDCVGVAAVRQLGLTLARGDFVAWLDDDDLWGPSFLSILIRQIHERNLDLAYSASIVFDGAVDATGLGATFKAIRWAPYRRALLENRNFIGSNAMLHKRVVGGKALEVPVNHYDDWSIALQFAASGRVGSVPVVNSFYNHNSRKKSITADRVGWKKTVDLAELRSWQISRFKAGNPQSSKAFSFGSSIHVAPNVASELIIVIPVYHPTEALETCLDSLAAASRGPGSALDVTYVVVDNSEDGRNHEYLTAVLAERLMKGQVVLEPKPGFSHAVNAGVTAMRRTSGFLAVVNSDTEVLDGSLAEMVSLLESDASIGMVSPEHIVDPGNSQLRPHWQNQLDDFPVDISVSAHHQNAIVGDWRQPEESLELQWAPFFFALFPYQIWNDVGGLHSLVAPHYSTDRIFCEAIRMRLGLRIVRAEGVRVFHHGGLESTIANRRGRILR